MGAARQREPCFVSFSGRFCSNPRPVIPAKAKDYPGKGSRGDTEPGEDKKGKICHGPRKRPTQVVSSWRRRLRNQAIRDDASLFRREGKEPFARVFWVAPVVPRLNQVKPGITPAPGHDGFWFCAFLRRFACVRLAKTRR